MTATRMSPPWSGWRSAAACATNCFFNRYVSSEELKRFLAAADLYVTPYANREQIASGTLAMALGMGKAVLSTPYRYAEEMLAGPRRALPVRRQRCPGRGANTLMEDRECAPLRKRIRPIPDHDVERSRPAVHGAGGQAVADRQRRPHPSLRPVRVPSIFDGTRKSTWAT